MTMNKSDLLKVRDVLDKEEIKYRYMEKGDRDLLDYNRRIKSPRIYVFGVNGFVKVINEYDNTYYVENTGIYHISVTFDDLMDMIHEICGWKLEL